MFFEVNSNHYWVEKVGEGPPLVMLHGFTGTTHTWGELTKKLANKFQIIKIDLPGHGKSTTPNIHSMEDCCYDLAQIFNQLQLSTVHLLGYSMGGRTALSFAFLYPKRVRTLVLESATPGIADSQEKKARVQKDEKQAKFILTNSLKTFIDTWEEIPLFISQKSLPLSMKERIRKERLSQTSHGLAQSLQTMGTGVMPSWWEQLGELTCPVAIIVGEKDQKFVQIGIEMEKRIPNSYLYVVPNSGHAIHVEQSEIFGTIVDEFYFKKEDIL